MVADSCPRMNAGRNEFCENQNIGVLGDQYLVSNMLSSIIEIPLRRTLYIYRGDVQKTGRKGRRGLSVTSAQRDWSFESRFFSHQGQRWNFQMEDISDRNSDT